MVVIQTLYISFLALFVNVQLYMYVFPLSNS